MLYRDIARLGILSFKLHVNAIQSPVHYYQIIKKKLYYRDGNRTDDVLFQFLFHDLPDYKKKLYCRDGNRTDDVLFQFLFHDLFHLRKSLEFSPNVPCFMLLTWYSRYGRVL